MEVLKRREGTPHEVFNQLGDVKLVAEAANTDQGSFLMHAQESGRRTTLPCSGRLSAAPEKSNSEVKGISS